eukprot:5268073-Pyramimonas_sp.AAC.1
MLHPVTQFTNGGVAQGRGDPLTELDAAVGGGEHSCVHPLAHDEERDQRAGGHHQPRLGQFTNGGGQFTSGGGQITGGGGRFTSGRGGFSYSPRRTPPTAAACARRFAAAQQHSQSVSRTVSRSAGQSVGQSDSQSVSRPVSRTVRRTVHQPVGQSGRRRTVEQTAAPRKDSSARRRRGTVAQSDSGAVGQWRSRSDSRTVKQRPPRPVNIDPLRPIRIADRIGRRSSYGESDSERATSRKLPTGPWILLARNRPRQAAESTVGQPMAVCRQGIYVEYSVEYSKRRALNGVLVWTVELKSKAFFCRRLRGLINARTSPGPAATWRSSTTPP